MLAPTAAKSLQSCPTLQPHRRQPTRFPCHWDSPGKNTGVGCHCLPYSSPMHESEKWKWSRSVVSDSLRPHESQHARPPCRSVVSGSVALLKEDFPGGSDGKATAYNAGDLGSIPGSGSSPGDANGSPLQYSCLENLMDRGVWWATVHKVAQSQTWLKWLNTHTYTHTQVVEI